MFSTSLLLILLLSCIQILFDFSHIESNAKKFLDIFPFLDRSEEKINIVEKYLKATKQFRNYNDEAEDPIFSKVRNKILLL